MIRLELWLMERPVAASAYFAVAACACAGLWLWNRWLLTDSPDLDYIDEPEPAVRTLDIDLAWHAAQQMTTRLK